MPANERRLWVGTCHHVLGEIKRIDMKGRRVRVLMLFSHAYECADDVPAEVDPLMMVYSGDNARCTICGSKRDWVLGDEAFSALLERMGKGRDPEELRREDAKFIAGLTRKDV